MKNYYVYLLLCSDDSIYTGVTNNVDRRFYEHNNGNNKSSYTYSRRPVRLIKSFLFNDINEAIAFEKQVKGWSRKKKLALVDGDWDEIRFLSMRKTKPTNPVK